MFVALPVAPGRAKVAVDGARALGIRGLSVTMPHKESVIPALDGLTPAASALGAVNCVLRAPHDDGLLLGDNTDGAGFLGGLRADFDLDVTGKRAVVLGAGGAGRAVVHALAGAGASSVVVVNRGSDRGLRAAGIAGGVGSFVAADDRDGFAGAVAGADLLVNATPIGMHVDGSDDTSPVPATWMRADLVVADLVYHPSVTPLMAAAGDAGARTANGLSMLVHQAAIAFEHWTGVSAPLEAMAVAAGGS